MDRWRWIDASARNLKQCFRSLKKSPGFASISILILAVGIGSNLAVFSTIDAMLLRPLPVQHSEELVRIASIDKDGRLGGLPSTILDGLKNDSAFQGLCGVDTSLLPAEIGGNLRSIGVAGFTGSCFEALGLHLQLGRPIAPGDDRRGTAGVAIITDSLWKNQFGRRPDILGKPISINGELFTIIGVTQKRFKGLLLGFPQDVMVPLLQTPVQLPSGRKPTYYWVSVLARRAAGVSQSQALASITARRGGLLEQSVPHRYNAAQRKEYLSQKLAVVPASTGIDYFLRDRFGQPLFALLGVCVAMLLIAGVNLGSLLLARGLNRRREVAVRLALGAKRSHIAGLLLLENALLVCAGAALGIWLGLWTAHLILAQGDQMFGNFSLNVGLDSRSVLFVIAAVLLILLIFAGAAIWQARRLCRPEALKESGRGVIASGSFPQKMLAGVQIALTLALVAVSSLFGASLKHMYDIDFGIKPRNVWDVLLSARPGGYRDFVPTPYYRGLLRRVESLPGVASASLSNSIPFFNGSDQEPVAIAEGGEPGREVQTRMLGVGDRFFETLGARIVAGDDFRPREDKSSEPSAILSWSLAQYLAKHAPGGHPIDPRELIGRHVRAGSETEYQHLKITGIASDVDLNLANLDDTKPLTVYLNFWQHRGMQGYPVLLIKTSGNTLPAAAVRHIVDEGGREYVERFTRIDKEIDNALVENRLVAYLASAFGVLALAMAAIGLFGLLSYQVANRTGEIGIRMALGARRFQIEGLILRQIVGLLVYGCLTGIALTLLMERAIRGLLYGVSAYNIALLLLSILVLAITALIAAWIPVHRASAIEPLEALRHE